MRCDLPDLILAEFGAPPLVNELLTGGQAQAAMNFWHFNLRARLTGLDRVLSAKDMLAELGPSKQPPLSAFGPPSPSMPPQTLSVTAGSTRRRRWLASW